MANAEEAFAIGVDSAPIRPLRNGRGESSQLVRPDSSESGLTVNLIRLKAGSEPGPYHHHAHASTFYMVIEGRVRFVVGGNVIDASPLEGCFMRPGVPHSTHNLGEADARVLLVFDSSTDDDFVVVELEGEQEIYSRPWKE